jgi:signal peptidase I
MRARCTRLAIYGALGAAGVAVLIRPRAVEGEPRHAVALAPALEPQTDSPEVARAPARMGPTRWARRVVTFAVLGAGTALILAVLIPFALGMRSYTVMSGSMEPAIDTGDVVVERNLAPEEIRPGDVVTFRDPTRNNRLITHRVRHIAIDAGVVHVVTRGDANTGVERWSVPVKGRVGLVVYRLPRIGYVAHAIGGTGGRVAFIVVPVLLIGLTLLVDLWRPHPRRRKARAALGEAAT